MNTAFVCLVAVFGTLPICQGLPGIAELVSNYARVRTSHPTTTTEIPPSNDTETIEYDDFDDFAEAANQTSRGSFDSDTMLKYFNGIVNMLALFYKFNGRRDGIQPQKLHFKPRQGELAQDVNTLMEPRYHPTTATQKFLKKDPLKKYQVPKPVDQEYQPIDNYPPYNPYGATNADSYKDGGKTSYDADVEQYGGTKGQDSPKTPMDEYMSQNVEIQPSYSYEIPPSQWETGGSAPWTKQKNPTWMQEPEDDAGQQWGMYDEPQEQPKVKKPSWKVKHPVGVEEGYGGKPPKSPTYEEEEEEEPEEQGKNPSWDQQGHYPVYPNYHHPHQDIEYDEPPEDHPVEDEHRESKHPHSYYFLGRKLWYVPLLFSVYFIIYIGALILKAVARHKIQLPEKLWELHEADHAKPHGGKHRRNRQLDDLNASVQSALDNGERKYKYM